MPEIKSKNPTVSKVLSGIYKIFKPFERVNKLYLFGIAFFWIGIVFIVWLNAPKLIPTPKAVITSLLTFLSSGEFYSDLISSIILTMKAMVLSIIIACAFAYLSVMPLFKPVAAFMMRLRFMSLVGLIFTFTLVLHGGGEVKISLLMFGIIPFFVLSLLTVIENVGKNEYELCQTLKFTRWEMLWHLIIKGRADTTIETVRANFAMAWLMITMVESFSMSEGGIGVMLFRLNKYNQLDKIFALQIVIFGLGILFDWFFATLRVLLFPYVKLNKAE